LRRALLLFSFLLYSYWRLSSVGNPLRNHSSVECKGVGQDTYDIRRLDVLGERPLGSTACEQWRREMYFLGNVAAPIAPSIPLLCLGPPSCADTAALCPICAHWHSVPSTCGLALAGHGDAVHAPGGQPQRRTRARQRPRRDHRAGHVLLCIRA